MTAGGPRHRDRQRLYWQCRRGMRELDCLLAGFLDASGESMEAADYDALETLLGYPDAVLLEWLMGRVVPFDKDVAAVVRKIRNAAAD